MVFLIFGRKLAANHHFEARHTKEWGLLVASEAHVPFSLSAFQPFSLSAGFSDVFSRKSGHKNCRADGTFDGLYVDCTFGRGPGDVTSIMK